MKKQVKVATLTSREYWRAFNKCSEYEYGCLGTDYKQLVRELNKTLRKKASVISSRA